MTQPTVSLKDLQYRQFLLVTPDSPLSEVTRHMDNDGLETAVVMQGKTLLGILSARDRLRAFHQHTPSDTPVHELMNTAHCTLNQSTSIWDACSNLLQQAEREGKICR